MKKQFEHEKAEECKLCHKIIHTDKDNWVALIDLKANEIMDVKFYHQFCLNDLVTGKGKVITKNFEEQVKKTVSNVFKNLKNLNVNQNQEKVYEIQNN